MVQKLLYMHKIRQNVGGYLLEQEFQKWLLKVMLGAWSGMA